MKQGMKLEKFIFRQWWTSVISRIRSWSQNFVSTKVELYSEVTLWKMIQDLMQSSLNKDYQHHKWQQQKSWMLFARLPGCARQAADAVSAHTQVKMEDAPTLLKQSQIGMFRFLDTSTTTQMTRIMVQYGRSSRPSWTEPVRSSSGRTVLWERQFEKSSIEVRFGSACFLTEKKYYSCQYTWTI